MGVLGLLKGACGFGMGASAGAMIGYFFFIFFQPNDVKDPTIRPLVEQDEATLQRMLQEIPLWVKNPDVDRVDWLNKFIEIMWPYLDKAICKIAREIAEPIIAEQIVKYKISSMEFETFTLGSLPPTFHGMKVYITDYKELIMEPSLKWAGNPNVFVSIKAFGLKATAQVVDLQVFAIPRITLKPLVPSFPCFANIIVSLMEKPHVDFGLKLLGADLMSIPCLYRVVQKMKLPYKELEEDRNCIVKFCGGSQKKFHVEILSVSSLLLFVKSVLLQETIKDQIANMYLWPKTLEVPIMDPAKAEKKPVGILHVKVVRAMKLRKKDLLGKSDSYVKLKLTEYKTMLKKTTVKNNNLNPEWNEEFNLVVKDPETQALEVVVFDWEQVGKHEKMGMNMIPLKELAPDETKTITLDLLKNMDPNDNQNDKFLGQVVLEVTYKEFKEADFSKDNIEDSNAIEKAPDGSPACGGLLVVYIHEAHDLEGEHHTNPYALILFRGEERKTKHIKKNRDPRWQEEFHFTLEEPPLNDKLRIEVVSKPPSIGIYFKEILGYVDISLDDVVHNKRINKNYNLIDSKDRIIQIELEWRTSS